MTRIETWLAMACLAIVAIFTTAAHAQQRTFYDSAGRVSGRSTTDSGGATTIYDSSGRVTGRTSTGSDGTTTIYDASGRNVGSVTTSKQQQSK
jgi:YD repeat-containing protein